MSKDALIYCTCPKPPGSVTEVKFKDHVPYCVKCGGVCIPCPPIERPAVSSTLNGITSAELDEYERIARTDDWHRELVGSDIRRLVSAARGNRKSSEMLLTKEQWADEILAEFKTEGNRTKAEEWEAAYAMLFKQLNERDTKREVINQGDALIRKDGELSGATVAPAGTASKFPTSLVHKICHAVSRQCMTIDEPERGPCTVDNCAAMKAAYQIEVQEGE